MGKLVTMDFDSALEIARAGWAEKGFAQRTRDQYFINVRRLGTEVGLKAKDGTLLEPEAAAAALQRWRRKMQPLLDGKHLSAAKVRGDRTALLAFFTVLIDQGMYPNKNPARDINGAPADERLPRPYETRSDLEAVFAQPDLATPMGLRDRVMMDLALTTAMRVHEVCGLTTKSMTVDLESDGIMLRFVGKNQRERTAQVPKDMARELAWYALRAHWPERAAVLAGLSKRERERALLGALQEWVRANRRTTPVALFQHPPGSGRIINVREADRRMALYVKAAGLADMEYGWHTIRHTSGTMLVEAGWDIRAIQEHMGHKNINDTVQYTKVAKKMKAAMAGAIKLPQMPEDVWTAA